MLEDPGIDPGAIADLLRGSYGVEATTLTFIRGYDPRAASYEVDSAEGSLFLKIRFDRVREPTLEVPAALRAAGVPQVLAPIRARTGRLWAPMGSGGLIVHPFVRGRSATEAGLTDDEWRAFGETLRAVHDGGLERRFAGEIPTDAFASDAPRGVTRALELAAAATYPSPAAARLAALLREHASHFDTLLARAEELGSVLRERTFHRVVCHADIHAANILVTDDGGILLVDWDGPMIAPRERDLMFVIGSRIARDVEPHEETRFFEGYGDVEVDAEALVYYRYERVFEDIGEFGTSVFGDGSLSEAARRSEVELAIGFFDPGGILETIEEVRLHR